MTTTKKKKKTGITRPRPDGGVKTGITRPLPDGGVIIAIFWIESSKNSQPASSQLD